MMGRNKMGSREGTGRGYGKRHGEKEGDGNIRLDLRTDSPGP